MRDWPDGGPRGPHGPQSVGVLGFLAVAYPSKGWFVGRVPIHPLGAGERNSRYFANSSKTPLDRSAELEREGVINTQPGLGVFVAEPKGELTREVRQERLEGQLDHFLTEAVHLGFSSGEVVAQVSDRVDQFQWQSQGSQSP